ncbi:MAG TPA: hypothetical protein VFP84_03280 [Kofleriaceae bacterium]|nr:hypothetical protein [Kofleriaceae bacterium]
MSYLDLPRLTFAGHFQADVSTVNNDPRHFDNQSFEARFQDFQTTDSQNGWWNPIGTGIFRLAGCSVTSAIGPGGPAAITDPALGFVVGNSPDRPSAKIVDLDPDWQLASALFGLQISIVDPATMRTVLVSDFEVAPFRDLWFSRGGSRGDSGASAMWQSRLTNLVWNLDGVTSPVLHALHAAAGDSHALSVRITTYGYQTSVGEANFTYGKILGAIGPVHAGEPRTCIAGRRFMPNGGNPSPANAACTASNAMTCFSAKVIGQTLVTDVSNALPLADSGEPKPLGNLQMALLRREDISEAAIIGSEDYIALGVLDATESLLHTQSGLQTFAIPASMAHAIAKSPLALVQISTTTPGEAQVILREQPGGRDVRVDDLSFKLDPNNPHKVAREVPIVATRYGEPLAGAAIAFQPAPPAPDVGDAPTDRTPETTPRAPIPYTNSPIGVLSFTPQVATTDEHGRATVTVRAPTRMGRPRGYLDGQLYAIPYNFADGQAALMQTFDQVSIMVYSSFAASAQPSWSEIQPILQQFANLYPIMSKGLFDFSQQAICDANAHLLHFVMSKDEHDPDYMPVTRDMSLTKREAILRYLESVMAASAAHSPDTLARYTGRCPFSGVGQTARGDDVPNKIIFNHLRSK